MAHLALRVEAIVRCERRDLMLQRSEHRED